MRKLSRQPSPKAVWLVALALAWLQIKEIANPADAARNLFPWLGFVFHIGCHWPCIFNRLWSENGPVIPFYIDIPESNIWYPLFAIKYYRAFASQYIS